MDPRDHRIHLGRRDSLVSPPQNHFLAKVCFSGPTNRPKRFPVPKGRARICPAGIFPTSAFSRRSGGDFPALKLRGGRASGVPLGAFAEVGFAPGRLRGGRECIEGRPWRPRIHVPGQGSGKSKPGKNFPDLRQFSEVGQISAQHKSA